MAKQVNALDWAKRMLDKEQDPVLKFLATPLDELPDHVQYAAYIHGKYNQMLNALEEQYDSTKGQREDLENMLVVGICESINPMTDAPYSLAYAQRKVAAENKKVRHLKSVELSLKYRALGIKRYLKDLEIKCDGIPGAQGLFNRTQDVESLAENQ